jgi:hypothetical protein
MRPESGARMTERLRRYEFDAACPIPVPFQGTPHQNA